MEASNGYEKIARKFIEARANGANIIGVSMVRRWAQTFEKGASVLDLGCGPGLPVSKTLIDSGLEVYGIDASETLCATFATNFPDNPIRCESVLDSDFYGKKFDGIIAWGLLFLLSSDEQETLIKKISAHLKPDGRLLFTSPVQNVKWPDAMTGLPSESLGFDTYSRILLENDLNVVDTFFDEGQNHYYSCAKLTR